MPGILQQRIQVAAVGGGGEQALERIRREQQEEQEADADEPHHAEHARDHLVGQVPAAQRHGDRPDRQHQHPQQHRALVRAPRRGDAVVQRQLRVRVGRDVEHREVVGDERLREAAEGDRDEQELPLRDRPRERHPGADAALRADDAAACRASPRAAARGSARSDRVRESSGSPVEGSDHGFSVLRGLFGRRGAVRLVDRVGGLRRHVVLVVLGEHFGRVEHAVGSELALRDDAFALLEQVGKDAGVDDRDRAARCR